LNILSDPEPVQLVVRARDNPTHTLAGQTQSLPVLLQRIYLNRGVRHTDELDLSLASLAPPDTLPDIDIAAERLRVAIADGQRIVIVGDFDADGATAVTLSVSLLEAMGARNVAFLVPNRFEFGYGLSPEIVELAALDDPDVIVTVDNGVSSVEGVARAVELGIDVIVTDHHLPGSQLPQALAIVNPNLPGSEFPSPAMAGVGVVYYLLSRTRAKLKASGWFATRPEPNLADWLDLVALGTVADVVPLDHNNRILVQQGIKRIRAGHCRPGIRALCQIAKRDHRKLDAADLGYAIGPRLNAAGRLDDMAIGIRCLLADTAEEARDIATALDELNRTRRALEQDMVRDAELIVAASSEPEAERYGICVYDPSWHQGVVGIVAGRMKDRFHRPVIAFAEAGDSAPDELKGSARSVADLHIRDALDAVASRYPGMLSKFGGHAMAAGLSIKRVHYRRFAKAFDAIVSDRLPETALQPELITDGELGESEISLDMARELAAAGPWGQQFPQPLFHGEFEIVSQRVVGEQHLKLVLKTGGKLVDAIAFRQLPVDTTHVLVAYRLAENDYRDNVTLQLMVEHMAALP
jgi:single-stranded-DNA-specific exonuclease